MKFVLEFEMDNAAFEGFQQPDEIARILRTVADKVQAGHGDGGVRDFNGNKVGSFEVQP